MKRLLACLPTAALLLAAPLASRSQAGSESLQGITFAVTSSGEGSQQQLTITATGPRGAFPPILQTVDGQLVAYAVTKNVLLPISLQELSGPMAQGYMGHDSFAVVENCLVRRFPVYKANDPNARATGGERQICYKLQPGEAGWILRPASALKF